MFVQPLVPPLRIIVAGATHIGQVFAELARQVGYSVTVVDPRSVFATEERFGADAAMAEWPQASFDKLGLDARTAVVALTHASHIDDEALTRRAAIAVPLHRRAGLARHACQAPGAAGRGRLHARGAAAHPRAHRPGHRRQGPGRDRRVDPRRDHQSGARCRLKAASPPVVLAAGASRRFGEENKLLARIDGRTLVERVVNALAIGGSPTSSSSPAMIALRSRPRYAAVRCAFVHNARLGERHGLVDRRRRGGARCRRGRRLHRAGRHAAVVAATGVRRSSRLSEQRKHDSIVYPTTTAGSSAIRCCGRAGISAPCWRCRPDKGAKALLQLVASECIGGCRRGCRDQRHRYAGRSGGRAQARRRLAGYLAALRR